MQAQSLVSDSRVDVRLSKRSSFPKPTGCIRLQEKRFNREESSRRVGGDGAPSQTAASDSDSDVANPTAAGDESSGVSDVETIPSSSDDDDVVDQRPNVSPVRLGERPFDA